MKRTLLTCLALLIFAPVVNAAPAYDTMRNPIFGNAGTNLRRYDSWNTCVAYQGGIVQSPCPTGYGSIGYVFNGSQCCVNSALVESKLASMNTEAESLEKVFATPATVDYYWGYAGTTARSSNTGRTVSAKARLDACLFYTDVDAIEAAASTTADRHALCQGSTYGCASTIKNEYCTASGTNDGVTTDSAVCLDRCDCVYTGIGNCENK